MFKRRRYGRGSTTSAAPTTSPTQGTKRRIHIVKTPAKAIWWIITIPFIVLLAPFYGLGWLIYMIWQGAGRLIQRLFTSRATREYNRIVKQEWAEIREKYYPKTTVRGAQNIKTQRGAGVQQKGRVYRRRE